jgi:ribose transport system ATP-binding protein
LISSYLPEVHSLSDQLHVFRSGSIVASHVSHETQAEIILGEAIGV